MKISVWSPLFVLFGMAITLAVVLRAELLDSGIEQPEESGFMKALMGESRRLVANHAIIKADVYFHRGYYPSIFDQKAKDDQLHMEELESHADHDHSEEGGDHDEEHSESEEEHEDEEDQAHEDEHEEAMAFLGEPKNWIDAFGRHFYPAEHSHLGGEGTEREMLPWLKLAAELNPERDETYTVGAYWLRTGLERPDLAEEFLREGFRANPDSCEIPLELGKIYEAKEDPERARNMWEMALEKWDAFYRGKEEQDLLTLGQILGRLGQLEERQGNVARAIRYFELLRQYSPHPEKIQTRLDELKRQSAD